MGFDDIEKILEAMKTNPMQTGLIVCIMAALGIAIVILKNYLSVKGKKLASDSGEGGGEKQPNSGLHIGGIHSGNQSPVIVGDHATISYEGISSAVVDELRKTLQIKDQVIERLIKTLDEKDVAIEDWEGKLRGMADKYDELEKSLAKREDEFAVQAKMKLDQWDLEGAEKLLLQSLDQNLKAVAERKKSAAADAFELGSIKQLQLEYGAARKYYEQAVELEPENTLYLNDAGVILADLGEYKKAINYYEQALASDLKTYGEDHPSVATYRNNLGLAWKSFGEYKKAIDYFEQALAIFSKVFGDDHPSTKTVQSNLALLKAEME